MHHINISKIIFLGCIILNIALQKIIEVKLKLPEEFHHKYKKYQNLEGKKKKKKEGGLVIYFSHFHSLK